MSPKNWNLSFFLLVCPNPKPPTYFKKLLTTSQQAACTFWCGLDCLNVIRSFGRSYYPLDWTSMYGGGGPEHAGSNKPFVINEHPAPCTPKRTIGAFFFWENLKSWQFNAGGRTLELLNSSFAILTPLLQFFISSFTIFVFFATLLIRLMLILTFYNIIILKKKTKKKIKFINPCLYT